MRTAVVSRGFIGRFADKSKAEDFAREIGGEVCHLLLQTTGLQATFGFAVELEGNILGLEPTEYIWV
jgi:hypothetical protein